MWADRALVTVVGLACLYVLILVGASIYESSEINRLTESCTQELEQRLILTPETVERLCR